MADAIINGVLKLSVGLISNKLRKYVADELNEGGLTDQIVRGMIVKELKDINDKLDALARVSLDMSISSLGEGFNGLYTSIEKTSMFSLPKSGKSSTKQGNKSMTVDGIANTIGNLKINPNIIPDSAKKSFEKAGEEAKQAFHTKTLSTSERVLAARIRIVSRILRLDNTDQAANNCLHYLRELNEMPSIKKIFSVHIQGGVESLFKKELRAEIVESVTKINVDVADFISKYTTIKMHVFHWPLIKCGKRYVHPIHCDKTNVPNLKVIEITPPWHNVVPGGEQHHKLHKAMCCLTKSGDLVCFTRGGRAGPQKLDTKTGILEPHGISSVKDDAEHPARETKVIGLAVDNDDTAYVLSGDKKDGYTLSVYPAKEESTHRSLEFLKGQPIDGDITISVTNVSADSMANDDTAAKDKTNTNIVIGCNLSRENFAVFVCDNKGETEIKKFEKILRDGHKIKSVAVISSDEIKLTKVKPAVFKDPYKFRIYGRNGKPAGKPVTFRPSEGDDYYNSILHNQANNEIICYQNRDGKILIEILCDQTAALKCSYVLHQEHFPVNFHGLSFVCHENGATALVGKNNVISLQGEISITQENP